MSNQSGSEGLNSNSEGKSNDINVEDLSNKLKELTQALENEKKSKERILNESKTWKEKAQTFQSKEEEIEKKRQMDEEARLVEQGQFKTLLEQREKELQALKDSLEESVSETNSYKKSIDNLKKASAFERAIGGKLKKDAYWNHVDFDSIVKNPETGEIDPASLKDTADSFLKEYKELVQFPNGGYMPNGTPAGSKGRLTHEQWKKLPLAERKKRMKDVVDS